MFLEYITLYNRSSDKQGGDISNNESGKARKLSAIRSCFSHFYKKGYLDRNITELVDIPKIHEKAIIRLDVDEVAKLLDLVENGDGLTDTQKRYHKYTKKRDLALLTLFLGTGIRISECVGLNITDFDFNNNGFKVTRKGGNKFIFEMRFKALSYLERKQIRLLLGRGLTVYHYNGDFKPSCHSESVKKYKNHCSQRKYPLINYAVQLSIVEHYLGCR